MSSTTGLPPASRTLSAWSGLRMIESTEKPAAPSVPAASRPTLPWPPIRTTRLDSDIGVLLANGQTAPRGVKAPCPVGRLVQVRCRAGHHRRVRRHRERAGGFRRAAARLLDRRAGRVRALEPVHGDRSGTG